MKTILLFFLACLALPVLGQDAVDSPEASLDDVDPEEQVVAALAAAEQLSIQNKREEALPLYSKVLRLQGRRRDLKGRFDLALQEISRTYLEKGDLAQAILVAQYTLKSSAKNGIYSGHAARSYRFSAELHSLFSSHAEAARYLLEERVPWYRMPSLKNDLLALINSIDLGEALALEGVDLKGADKYLTAASRLLDKHADDPEYQSWKASFLRAKSELSFALALLEAKEPERWQEELEKAQSLLSEARQVRAQQGLVQARQTYKEALLAAKIFHTLSYAADWTDEDKVAALNEGITELEQAYQSEGEPLLQATLKHKEGVLRRRLAGFQEDEPPNLNLNPAAEAFHQALLISERYLRELQSPPILPELLSEAIQFQLQGESAGLEPYLEALRRLHATWLGDYLDTVFAAGTRVDEAVDHLMMRRLGRKEPVPQLEEKDVLIDTFLYRQVADASTVEPKAMYASLLMSPALGERGKFILYPTPAGQVHRLIVDWKLGRNLEAFGKLWTPLLKPVAGYNVNRIFIGGDGVLGSVDYSALLIPSPLPGGQPTAFSQLPIEMHYGQTGFEAWFKIVAVDQP